MESVELNDEAGDGLMIREVTLPSPNRLLAARLIVPHRGPNPHPGILFIHGLHSDQEGYLPRAKAASLELGTVCLTFDLGGHGASEGIVNELAPRDHLEDVLTAFDYMDAQDHVDPSRMGVCAASYGAYLAALLVLTRPVQRLLLRAPALYADSDFDTPLGQGRKSNPQPLAALPLESVARLGRNLLVVESEKDEFIPREVVESYLGACPEASHRVIRGAGHALDRYESKEMFIQLIVDWFREL